MKRPDNTLVETNQKLMAQVADLTQQVQLLERKQAQSEQAYTHLLNQVKQMNRYRFGQRSERYIDPDNPQISLFEALEEAVSQPTIDNEDDIAFNDDSVVDIAKARKDKQSRKPFAEGLPRKKVIIKVNDDLRTCTCGCQKKTAWL